MKYIRQVMATGLAIIFLIALVIGTGVIFSIRNVNVTFISYSNSCEEAYVKTRANLNKLKGSGLLFISDGDVTGKVSDPQLLVIESYEKKIPCTVNVVVRERVESFAVATEGGYDIYDEVGKIIRSTSDESIPLNRLDGSPDVLLDVPTEQIVAVAEICASLKEEFGGLRRTVESVAVKKYLELQMLVIKLRSGLTISLNDWQTDTESKVRVAREAYSALGDLERTRGTLSVLGGRENTLPTANYVA